jgi:hypothetical protein
VPVVKKGLLVRGFNPPFYFGKAIDSSEYRCRRLTKRESLTGSRTGSGSATGSAYFLLEAEVVEVEAETVRAEAVKIVPLLHHCTLS